LPGQEKGAAAASDGKIGPKQVKRVSVFGARMGFKEKEELGEQQQQRLYIQRD
jgi:hypothetical protein